MTDFDFNSNMATDETAQTDTAFTYDPPVSTDAAAPSFDDTPSASGEPFRFELFEQFIDEFMRKANITDESVVTEPEPAVAAPVFHPPAPDFKNYYESTPDDNSFFENVVYNNRSQNRDAPPAVTSMPVPPRNPLFNTYKENNQQLFSQLQDILNKIRQNQDELFVELERLMDGKDGAL